MTFKQIQDRALEECGYDFTTSSSTPRTRMKNRINDVYRRLLAEPGLSRLLRQTTKWTFASVASTSTYGMPSALGRLTAITERDNDARLEMRDLDWLRATDPGLTASGTPTVWVPVGWYPVKTQPSAASSILVVSTSASDTANLTMAYLSTTGHRVTVTVALNGTSNVTVVATAIALEILELSIASAAVGTVTLYHTSVTAGNELGTIQIGATSNRYLHVQLWQTPSAAITYYADFTRELADLSINTEEPAFPPDFHQLLWRGAVMDEWTFKDDTRAEYMRQLVEQDKTLLRTWIWDHVDYRPSPNERSTRVSRLGGWFPAGS